MNKEEKLLGILAILVLGAIGGVIRVPLESMGAYGILAVNLVGSFALGLVNPWLSIRCPTWLAHGIRSGLVGSFTTFSAFMVAADHLVLVNPLQSLGYVSVAILGGLILVALGDGLAKMLRGQTPPLRVKAGPDQQNAGNQ